MKNQLRVNSQSDKETIFYDFDDYIVENLKILEAERTTVPSVGELMDFSSTNEDELGETEAQIVPFNIALKSF